MLQARRGPYILVEVRYQLKQSGALLISIEARNAGLSGDEILVDFALPADRFLQRTLRSVEGISGVAVASLVEISGGPTRPAVTLIPSHARGIRFTPDKERHDPQA